MKRFKKLAQIAVSVIVIFLAFRIHPVLGGVGVVLLLWTVVPAMISRYYTHKGSILFAQGETEQALQWYRKAYNSYGARPNQKIGYGYLLLKTGALEQAEEVMQAVLEKPLDRDEKMTALSNYALVQWKKGDLDGAIKTMETVLQDYRNTTAYGTLGFFLIEKGDLKKALKFNKEAYLFNDDNPNILNNYGRCLYLKGQLKQAADILAKGAAQNPSFPEIYFNYGTVLIDQKKYDLAEQQFEKARALKPSLIHAATEEKIAEKLAEIAKKRDISPL